MLSVLSSNSRGLSACAIERTSHVWTSDKHVQYQQETTSSSCQRIANCHDKGLCIIDNKTIIFREIYIQALIAELTNTDKIGHEIFH